MANLFIDKRNASGPVDEWGHEGNDTLLGSRFDDRLKGAQGNDTIEGNGGDDYITDVTHFGIHAPIVGFSFDNTDLDEILSALDVNGEFVEHGGNPPGSTLYFGGNDTFSGDDGDDIIYGYNGRDLLNGGDDDDEIYGGSGNDTVIGGDGRDLMAGDSGADYMLGGDGDDVMVAGSGDDRLDGGMGADYLVGRSGLDTVIYDSSRTGVAIDLGAGTADGINGSTISDAHGDQLTEIENIDGSRFGDILTGDRGANDFFGNFGNDILDGRSGGDRLDGAAGLDTVTYARSSSGVAVALDDANRKLVSSASGGDAAGDTLISIENLDGSAFGDSLTGNSLSNIFNGSNGNDRLFGLAGDDRLFGGAGHDTVGGGDNNDFISGGSGADILDGGTGNDTVSFAENLRPVTVTLGSGTSAGQASTFLTQFPIGSREFDTLYNFENILGSATGDRLTGNSERNILNGGSGNDTLVYTAGGDRFDGDDGIDMLDMSGLQEGVSLTLGLSFQTQTTLDQGQVRDIENIRTGGFNDTIIGSSADNRIEAGGGVDVMSGLAGNDTFVFSAINDSGLARGRRDVITDFTTGDRLDLSAIDTVPELDGDQIFVFLGEGRFTGSGGEIRATVTNAGNMLVAIDLDGDRQMDSRIQLNGVSELQGSDFLL